jgi:hypothetical protein
MKILTKEVLILLLSIVTLTTILFKFNFNVDTKEMLEVFVPLVWGVFIALGGSMVKLNNRSYLTESKIERYRRGQGFSFILSVLMMMFLGIATIYPTRNFILKNFTVTENIWNNLSSLYDSLCFSTFTISGVGSLFVGGLLLVSELREESN